MRKFLALVALFCLLAARSWAVCVVLGFGTVPATLTFSSGSSQFNVFDSTQYMQTVAFQVSALVSLGSCPYYVTLEPDSGTDTARKLTQGSNTLTYKAFVDSGGNNLLLSNADAGGSTAVTGSFGVLGITQTANLNFYWTIPSSPLQIVPAAGGASYTDTGAVLKLYSGTPGSGSLVDSKTISFQTQVVTSVDLSVEPTGTSFNAGSVGQTLNFGNITSGAQQSCDISIRSNSGYNLSLQSANGLLLTQTGVSTTIPYTVKVNGVSAALGSGTKIQVATANAATTTPATGTNLSVQATIGTLTGSEISGNYQDVLTATITAN